MRTRLEHANFRAERPPYAAGLHTLGGMCESPGQVRKHIAVLSNFETTYREFVDALEKFRSGEGKTWSEDEYESRRRQILKDAVRAQKAMEVSGVGTIALRYPNRYEEASLPALVFYFRGGGPGLSLQRRILDMIPSQIAGLEVRLEEAEAAEEEAGSRRFGEVFEQSQQRHHQAQQPPEERAGKETEQQSTGEKPDSRPWWENPWIVGIGVTVIGGGVVTGIAALLGWA